MSRRGPSPPARPWTFLQKACGRSRSGDSLLLCRHRTGALVDRQRPQLQVVGIGILGLPGGAVAAIEIDEQAAGVGLVTHRAGRVVLAIEHAGAQRRRELRFVEALDAVERDRRAGISRGADALLAAGQGILRARVGDPTAGAKEDCESPECRFPASTLARSG